MTEITINEQNKKEIVAFDKLEIGDVFLYADDMFIKHERLYEASFSGEKVKHVNSLNLHTGTSRLFIDELNVILIKKLNITYEK